MSKFSKLPPPAHVRTPDAFVSGAGTPPAAVAAPAPSTVRRNTSLRLDDERHTNLKLLSLRLDKSNHELTIQALDMLFSQHKELLAELREKHRDLLGAMG